MRRAGESSSFLRRAARFDLGSLPSYEVEEAVRITIESAGRTISQPALDAAVQAIGGLGSGNAPALPQPRARACLRGGFGVGSRGGVREGRPARCELNGSSRLSAVDARHIRGLSTVESTILGPPACLCASSRRILGASTVDSTPIRPVFAKTASTRGTLGSPNARNRRLELHKGLPAACTSDGARGWRCAPALKMTSRGGRRCARKEHDPPTARRSPLSMKSAKPCDSAQIHSEKDAILSHN